MVAGQGLTAPASDPFGTAGLRSSVLDAWSRSPARFREDANAEEALATGGYAGRLLIELAANAVDAAREMGVPGRVRFSLDSAGELRAANVGAPLTAAGVSGLASLRASAKRGRGATVGHFGVGFTAVMAVSDEPAVVSRTGGIAFSRARTTAAVTELDHADLTAELAARAGQVPALRLPWPVPEADLRSDPVPDGFDTQVRLPLREEVRAEVRKMLDDLGDELLWALPGLAVVEVVLPGRPDRMLTREDLDEGVTVITAGVESTRYVTGARSGTIPAALLADRPVEERARDEWTLTWVWPEPVEVPAAVDLFDVAVPAPHFLGAPTPTDEPLSLPARLIGTFPVDDTRRRLASGPLTDHLLAQAAQAYVDLAEAVAPGRRLSLVPTAGFPLGPVDATLRAGIVRRLSRSPVLVSTLGDLVVPSSACVITGISDEAAFLLGRAVPGLLPPPHHPSDLDALRMLGVSILPLADATAALAGLDDEPAFWRDVYSALADQDSEDLANLPVPLIGGGRRIGPAGLLLPAADAIDRHVLTRAVALAPDLRIVHPDAVHPLLSRLGAGPADAAALVSDPALIEVFARFREDLEDDDPDLGELSELADLAFDLARSGAPAGGLLDDVVLTDVDGQPWPAAELLAPGAPLAGVLAADADLPLVGAPWSELPPETLSLVGVRTGLKIVRVDDRDADLPDLDEWWSEVVGEALPPDAFDAVADLDLVDDDRWPELLTMLAADPAARATLTGEPAPSYTRWWLTRYARLGGHPPTYWRRPDAVVLTGLYDPLPVAVDPAVAAAIGVLTDASDADGQDLLDRLADQGRVVPAGAVPALTAAAETVLERDPRLRLPDLVRALNGAVVAAADALVLDRPWLAQVLDPGRLVAGGAAPDAVAAALELELASEVVRVPSAAVGAPLSDAESAAAARAAVTLAVTFPSGLTTDPELTVDHDGAPRRVRWWPGPGDGVVTDGSPDGIGRAVAHLAGRWSDRALAVAAAAGDPLTFAEDGLS
ncbi:hypothetical protein SAMN04515671_0771 [Nakamurella panacisegetis]|uniref:Uncharacterized protein n=1 Tax=Nakamurella panacisegetis TaxID=1090615 RepID=A0A1H0J448_9ACTN|nr:hypothetical protein [Nakamurella panacisegetis]SDO38495.1 hypothetical protein SAMN04515671_0771 [Nakamurella panacisegetis]